MIKSLNINPYIDGFNTSQIDCMNIPVACASGFFNYENYYYYCFLLSALSNYIDDSNFESLSFKEQRNIILNTLGLSLESYQIRNTNELITFIKHSIDLSLPLVFTSNYSQLFYTPQYLEENHSNHTLLISGYDYDKSILIIKETDPIDTSTLKNVLKSNPVYTMYLKLADFIDIWESTNKYFMSIDNTNTKTIYRLERIGKPIINNYKELIKYFYDNFKNKQCSLEHLVINYNFEYKEYIPSSMQNLRNTYLNSLHAFFRCFENLSNDNIEKDLRDSFYKFKDRYLDSRSKLLYYICKHIYTHKEIENDKINEILNEIRLKNTELFYYILHIIDTLNFEKKEENISGAFNTYKITETLDDIEKTININTSVFDNKDTIKNDGNLALECNVIVSSSVDDRGWYKDCLVDGITDTILGLRGWSSNNDLTKNHSEWIKIDLGKSFLINTVNLYPRNDQKNEGFGFPLDFDIILSCDDINWSIVAHIYSYAHPIDGNVQVFQFNSESARYVKIIGYNLRPNPNENNLYRMQFTEIEVYMLE